MIFLAVHNGQPKELPLDKAIRAFLDHRTEVVRRRRRFPAQQGPRPRAHSARLPDRALDHLDNVIRTIRQSGSPPRSPRARLFQYFSGKSINLRGTTSSPASPSTPKNHGVDMTFSTTGTRSSSATARSTQSSSSSSTASPSSASTNSSKSSPRSATTSPNSNPSSPPQPEALQSHHPKSSPKSATNTATPAAPRSSTRPPTSSSRRPHRRREAGRRHRLQHRLPLTRAPHLRLPPAAARRHRPPRR